MTSPNDRLADKNKKHMDGCGAGCDGSGSLPVWAPWDCSGHRPTDPAQPVKFLLHKNLKFSVLQICDHFL